MKELVEYIAKSLVDDPSQVEVTEVRRANSVILKLEVAQEDKGRVIGRNGRVANAIRSLLRVMAARDLYIKQHRRASAHRYLSGKQYGHRVTTVYPGIRPGELPVCRAPASPAGRPQAGLAHDSTPP